MAKTQTPVPTAPQAKPLSDAARDQPVSNRMDEFLARRDAEDAEVALRPPEHLASSCGEAVLPRFYSSHIVDTLQNPNMVNVIASEHRVWCQKVGRL